jgi:hypothetical protein
MSLRGVLAVSLVGTAGAAACNGQVVDMANVPAGDAGGHATALSEGGPDAGSGSESDALLQPDASGQDEATVAYEGGAPMDVGGVGVVSSESGAVPICAGPPATCSTPPGLVEPFSTIDRVYAWVAGKWVFCTGQATWQTAPSDAIGVEFTPGSSAPTAGGSTAGGNMYYLVQGPSGPVRGAGFNYQLTYDVSPEGTSYQFNVHPAPNSGFWLTLKYSACPRELDVIVFYSTTDSVLIPTN